MIKVLLVDDHSLVRTGLRRLLEDQDGIVVIAEASSGEDAITKAREHNPDVVLMDVSMPGMGGLEATRRLARSREGLRVIVITAHGENAFPKRMFEAGASGFMTKDTPVEQLADAIRQVARGGQYISPAIAQQMALASLPGHAESPIDTLSQREMQVLLMLTQGMSNQHISDKLCLSPKTVSTYRSRLLEKLNVSNDVELIRFAMKEGLIEQTA